MLPASGPWNRRSQTDRCSVTPLSVAPAERSKGHEEKPLLFIVCAKLLVLFCLEKLPILRRRVFLLKRRCNLGGQAIDEAPDPVRGEIAGIRARRVIERAEKRSIFD